MEDVQEKATAAGLEVLREWLAHRRQLPFFDALMQVRFPCPLPASTGRYLSFPYSSA